MAGGREALAWAEAGDADAVRRLSDLLGERAASLAFEDEELLPLALSALDDDEAALTELRARCEPPAALGVRR